MVLFTLFQLLFYYDKNSKNDNVLNLLNIDRNRNEYGLCTRSSSHCSTCSMEITRQEITTPILLTYFVLLHIVVIQQSVCLFKIYGPNLPTEKNRKNHIGSLLLKKIEGKY